MRFHFLTSLLLFFSVLLSAQNDTKIEHKLSKLFNSGQYEKCRNKALKINKKNPKSDIPEYYLAKISLQRYSSSNKASQSGFKYLSKAISYSNKLPDNYEEFKLSIKDSLRSYIFYLQDGLMDTRKIKTALSLYNKTYHDTLHFNITEIKTDQVPIYKFSNSTNDSLRWELVKFAEKQQGVKYSYAGEKPETGFDCSGFTKYVYDHIGIELPHNAHKQSSLKGKNKALDKAKPGDLIFFGRQGKKNHYTVHTGIVHTVFEGDIKVIHCVSGGVSIDGSNSSWEHYWKDKVLFVKTLPELKN